jgi:uncharacterized protein YfaS (alpha-2-macroglobulin family)
MASSIRSTALILDAYLAIAPRARLSDNVEVVQGAAAWLQAQRQDAGWGTTNETAYSILALSDYLEQSLRATAPANLTWKLNGIAAGSLSVKQPLFEASLSVPRVQMQEGINLIQLDGVSGAPLYFVLTERMALPEMESRRVGVLNVEREYRDSASQNPVTTFQKGQVLQVVLKVTLPDDGYYLIVEDLLPGGLEAINENLNTASRDSLWEDAFQWESYGYNFKEIHPDQVSFFITHWDRGSHTITYRARAVTDGEFYAPPAEVYAMYNPADWGSSSGKEIVILEER